MEPEQAVSRTPARKPPPWKAPGSLGTGHSNTAAPPFGFLTAFLVWCAVVDWNLGSVHSFVSFTNNLLGLCCTQQRTSSYLAWQMSTHQGSAGCCNSVQDRMGLAWCGMGWRLITTFGGNTDRNLAIDSV